MTTRSVIASRRRGLAVKVKPGAAARKYTSSAPSRFSQPATVRGGRVQTSPQYTSPSGRMQPYGFDALQERRVGARAVEGLSPEPRLGYSTPTDLPFEFDNDLARKWYLAWGGPLNPLGVAASDLLGLWSGQGRTDMLPGEDATSTPRGALLRSVTPERRSYLEQRDYYDQQVKRDDAGQYGRARTDTAYDEYMKSKLADVAAFMRMREDAIKAGEVEVAAQYNDLIDGIRGEIADAEQAQAESNAAFARYQARVAPYQQAAVDAAEATDLSGVEAQQDTGHVSAAFDSGVAVVDEVLAKIAPDNADLAEYAEAQVRDFQVAAEDMLREDMSNVMRVAEAGQKFAKSMAEALQQQDETMTDIDRQKVEVGIQQQIDQLQEQIAEAEKQKQAAIAKAREEIAAQFGTPDYFSTPEEAWQYVFNSWVDGNGIDFETAPIISGIVRDLSNAGARSRAEAEDLLRQNLQGGNLAILEDVFAGLGILFEGAPGDGLSVQVTQPNTYAALMQAAAGNMAAIKGNPALYDGLPDEVKAALEEFEQWDDYDVALDAFDLWREHVDSWDEYQQGGDQYTNAVRKGGQAPRNAANKNKPEYVYRREVVAPYYAAELKKRFPGVEIGGLGYIRPADQEGGGKAVNSDHQSGGAIDVYHKGGSPEDTDATLKLIAAWAMRQPGVSFVTYENNKAHQTGTNNAHVHVSFQVGWKVPEGRG